MCNGTILLIPVGDALDNDLGIPTSVKIFGVKPNIGGRCHMPIEIPFQLSEFIYMRDDRSIVDSTRAYMRHKSIPFD